jgi:hypothetical protein
VKFVPVGERREMEGREPFGKYFRKYLLSSLYFRSKDKISMPKGLSELTGFFTSKGKKDSGCLLNLSSKQSYKFLHVGENLFLLLLP